MKRGPTQNKALEEKVDPTHDDHLRDHHDHLILHATHHTLHRSWVREHASRGRSNFVAILVDFNLLG